MMGCGHDSRKTGSAQCGNSIVEEGETCDDGNADELDGCSSVCATEEGWECPPAGGACQRQEVKPHCGNGRIEPDLGEVCDAGENNGVGCTTDCQLEEGYECPIPGQA